MQEKIKKWYQQGLWTAEMVRNAIGKVITAEQAENIIKEEKTNDTENLHITQQPAR